MGVFTGAFDLERIYCMSTDIKPIDNIPTGTYLQYLNTGERFIWDGSKWVEDLSIIYAVNAGLRG
jgi:hypothetical protein